MSQFSRRPDRWFAPASRIRSLFRRFRDDRGVAAVEFALILPIMLGLYLSTVVATKAYMASRKVALVARALSDITSRQSTPCGGGNPCVVDADLNMFFNAASAIMAPYPTTSLKMTISRIDIMQDTANNWWAFTKWSVVNNGGVARPCNGGNGAFSHAAGAALTDGSTNPLLTGDVSVTTSGYQNSLPAEYTAATPGLTGQPAKFLILADVAYTYTPGFTFKVFNWTNLTSIRTGWSQGFWSRTGFPIGGASLTASATKCAQNDPANS
jgi:Flp pilus assembly protein TadG